jgi:plasmid stabilization system protein ParE
LHALENAQTTGRPATVRENHRALSEGAHMLYFRDEETRPIVLLVLCGGRMAIAASEASIRAFE